jgi:hypothetical protein
MPGMDHAPHHPDRATSRTTEALTCRPDGGAFPRTPYEDAGERDCSSGPSLNSACDGTATA